MAISFNAISQNVRASNLFIELMGKRRSLASLFIPPLVGIIGLYDPDKTGVTDYLPVFMSSQETAGILFGFGSHIHRQALAVPEAVFNSGGGVYAFPVPEAESATAASITITFTGTATSGGQYYFAIGGVLVTFAVVKDDTESVWRGKG